MADLDEQKCPICETPVKALGAANTAPPFSEQINSFFKYPFKPAPLGIIVLTACALTFAGNGIVGLVVYVSIACIFTKYAYSIIQSSKDGASEPPGFRTAFSEENLDVFFKQLAVIFVAGVVLTAVAFTGSAILFGIGSFLINGLMPASIIVLALTNQIGAALHPGILFSVVKAVGKRYLILWMFLFILSQGPIILLSLLVDLMPMLVSVPITVSVFGYFALVMSRLLGYTVYENQGSFGFVSDENSREADLTETEIASLRNKQAILKAEVLVKEGEYKRARKTLSDRLNQGVRDVNLEDYYHRLMVITGDTESVIKNADPAIEAFVKDRRPDLAMNVYKDCLKIQKSFRPSGLESSFDLAKLLHSKLDLDLAIHLLANAHKRHPKHKLIPDAYVLLAEILILGKGESAQGKQYIEFVKKHYPDYTNAEKFTQLELAMA